MLSVVLKLSEALVKKFFGLIVTSSPGPALKIFKNSFRCEGWIFSGWQKHGIIRKGM